jgi:hypothetical protein
VDEVCLCNAFNGMFPVLHPDSVLHPDLACAEQGVWHHTTLVGDCVLSGCSSAGRMLCSFVRILGAVLSGCAHLGHVLSSQHEHMPWVPGQCTQNASA